MDSGDSADAVAVLSDATVTLRAQRRDDLRDIVLMCRDPEMVRWTTVPDPYTMQDAEAYLSQTHENRRSGTPLAWAIEVDGRFAGNIDLRLDGARGAEIGYGLGPWARSQGTLTRALRLLLPWAFEHLDLDVVRWRAEVGNWASRRVAWAVGFEFDGRQRGLLPARGAISGEPPLDAWVASLWRGTPLTPARPWLTPPLIRTGPVTLRALGAQDVPRIAEACSDPLTQTFVTALPDPYTVEDARAYLEQVAEGHATGTALTWAVADASGEVLLGNVQLFDLQGPNPVRAEIGYWMHPQARGRGMMTTAVTAVARHALLPTEVGGLGLRSVCLRAASENKASQRVAEKAGLLPSGLHRAAQLNRDGSTSDLVYFDLVADELPVDGTP
jgi:RimJ/RimL family protein N-acetyltransferase